MKTLKTKKHKGSLLLKISVIALSIFMLSTLFYQRIRINEMNLEISEVENQIELQEVTNDSIRESIEESENNLDEFAEEYARSEFDYAMPNEEVFVNIGGN